jgi:ribonucleoside-diphosphate reductase alpha chain
MFPGLPSTSMPLTAPPADSPFIDPTAVEAWDAWFRWRSNGELRDLTVEASWDRVAEALAAVEPEGADAWRQRFCHAMAGWRLLPDARVLATAGTGRCEWPGTDLVAELNLAAFVRDAFREAAHFDEAAFRECAGLAVRLLDNALALSSDAPVDAPRLRIGFIGLGDALEMLGLGYGTPGASELATCAAAVLAEAAFEVSVSLAGERGARVSLDPARRACAEQRGFPAALVAEAERLGLRHAALTAIDSQPRLALLANNVADALDPVCSEYDWQTIDAPGGSRCIRSPGFAHCLRRRQQITSGRQTPDTHDGDVPGVVDQILLRAQLARWFDAPIDYAFRTPGPPDPASAAHWTALAVSHALPMPRWRGGAADSARAVD